ncbi:hypothetical protein GCM10008018_44390 [Paenibacillus marchantiophytorum]|uniref:Response regulator n=1 Tax=Paenibacillus marchantiophytorum TaxID=1619310 RepID=A0ABQ1EYC9_9BACL|nr:response regulator [Paenibacillus marchantiophytorum]GFZ93161.1 hypothetical protein GCM10008018_44390 [Paenibacillus marchantiophytorum]
MKLLLVDDEQLIRKGILMKTDWQQYGIDEVKQADDGRDAVRIAELFRPDILLTDIRMPRMDGIEAARCIRMFCPKVCIIFMSGFSDKEYLKAAISMQAVDYVEKPIHPDELGKAILNASSMIKKDRQTDMGEEESIPLIKREIAALLCSPHYQADKLARLFPLIGSQLCESNSCLSSILKWHHPIEQPESLLHKLESAAQTAGFNCFIMMKDDFHVVIHLISRSEKDVSFEDKVHRWVRQDGAPKAKNWLANLMNDIRKYPDTSVTFTKGIYLQLYQMVQQVGKESGIPSFKQEASVIKYAERLYACQTLDDLDQLLNDELDVLFDYLEARKGNSIIRHVTLYIERNYRNRQLSLNEISEFVGVTVPHLCFVFKEGTDMTIKHFLSEYRIDRAKELLVNRELKLFDIALQVGYGDGEYFSKIFKKVTGLQPSEYRKRLADV